MFQKVDEAWNFRRVTKLVRNSLPRSTYATLNVESIMICERQDTTHDFNAITNPAREFRTNPSSTELVHPLPIDSAKPDATTYDTCEHETIMSTIDFGK